MKFLVVLAVAVACASADVSHILKDESNAQVLRQEYDLKPDGSYQYVYETSNGIAEQAVGEVQNQNSEYPTLKVSGGFRYSAPGGEPIEVTYVADENGYRPQGSHLPVEPEIPEGIKRALAYIAAQPSAVDRTKRALG